MYEEIHTDYVNLASFWRAYKAAALNNEYCMTLGIISTNHNVLFAPHDSMKHKAVSIGCIEIPQTTNSGGIADLTESSRPTARWILLQILGILIPIARH